MPRKLTLTLFTCLALLLALSSFADAKGYAAVPARREHAAVNRMLRKRSPQANPLAAAAANDPPNLTSSITSTAATSTTAATTSATSAATSAQSTTAATSTSASTSSSSSSTSTSATSSATSASSSSSSSATSSTTGGLSGVLGGIFGSSSSSSTSSSSTSTSSSPTTSASVSLSTSANKVTSVTLTSFADAASATQSSSDDSTSTSSSTSKTTKTTITVLIVVAASVGGAAIIWTVIRKWKFRPSAEFEDRMQPIDWQPTNNDDAGVAAHRVSTASHGSFTSGNGPSGEDGYAGGVSGSGYGATSESGHTLQPVPDHDFTAGAAAVGGYADLARGPSPAPPMQELGRGPSVNRGQGPYEYDYGVPLHHQGYAPHDAYDYNGAPAAMPRY